MRFFRPLVAFSLTVSFAAVIGSGGSFLVASDASAASACGNAGTLSTSAGVSTCTYTAAGEDTFSVPAGVTQVSVVAIGGAVGAGGTYNAGIGGLGGSGADVSATVTGLSVSTLYVEVGSNGTDGTAGQRTAPPVTEGPTVAVSVDSLGATAAAAVVAVELRTCERRPRRPRTSPVRPATRVSWSPAVAVAAAVPITPKVVREATLVTTP